MNDIALLDSKELSPKYKTKGEKVMKKASTNRTQLRSTDIGELNTINIIGHLFYTIIYLVWRHRTFLLALSWVVFLTYKIVH